MVYHPDNEFNKMLYTCGLSFWTYAVLSLIQEQYSTVVCHTPDDKLELFVMCR